jgi:hypothetical protein
MSLKKISARNGGTDEKTERILNVEGGHHNSRFGLNITFFLYLNQETT